MEQDTKAKLRAELRSFFGLTILNLALAAIVMAIGISATVTNVLALIDGSQVQPLSILLMGLGVAAMAAGFYWLLQVVEIVDGVSELKVSYDRLGEGDGEQATSLFVRMLAYYRSNRLTVSRMKVLGRLGGALFIVMGAIGVIQAMATMASSGILTENITQLVGGVVAAAVGIAGFLVARYFSLYSKVWDSRLQEAAKIEDALRQKLEANE